MRRSYILITFVVLAGIGFGVGYLLRSTGATVNDRPQVRGATDRYIQALSKGDAAAAWAETAQAARTRYKVTQKAVTAYVKDAHADWQGDCTLVKEEGFVLSNKDGEPAAAKRRFLMRCGEKTFDVNTEVVAEAGTWRTSFFQYGVKKSE
jgi:hypothetical protein